MFEFNIPKTVKETCTTFPSFMLNKAKVTIYDRGRPFYCNKDFIRIPLAEGKLGEISNRIELYDRKVINLNISGFFTKKIIIDVI